MPAILASSFMSHARPIIRSTRSSHQKIRNRQDNHSVYEKIDDNSSYGSRGSLMDISDCDSIASSTFLYPYRSNSSSSTSSFYSLSSLKSNQEISTDDLDTNWGYFVDVTMNDEEIEQYSRVLTSRNKSRMNLVRQTQNI